jgi:hypothetical protein
MTTEKNSLASAADQDLVGLIQQAKRRLAAR